MTLPFNQNLLVAALWLWLGLLPLLFHPLHQLGMVRPLDAFLVGLVEELGIKIMAALVFGF